MIYGMPYKGSKNAIAEWVIKQLPEADVFVDLFAGGCAITHAALVSGKYKRVICNDISGTPKLFEEVIHGDLDGFAEVPSRTDFFLSEDVALKLLYSFGNDRATYLWGGEYEMLKVPASRMLSAPSLHERRRYYMQFMKELSKYIRGIVEDGKESLKRPHELQGLERLEGLQGLERLETVIADYRNVNIPSEAVVYADPPYRNTGEHYGGFDFEAFDDWLATVDHPVYVSEFDAPRGCVCIAERSRTVHMAAKTVHTRTERLFVQKRFAEGGTHKCES